MNNADFWASVRTIITAGFTPEGLLKQDGYAAQFISGKLVYQRFSPQAGVQKEEFVISDQWSPKSTKSKGFFPITYKIFV